MKDDTVQGEIWRNITVSYAVRIGQSGWKHERLFDEAAVSHDPEKLRLLNACCTSGEWLEDCEADERGELPPDLKRGILSQDALYELLAKAEL